MGSVMIADIDFRVLILMQERGWPTVLGAKNSYVVKSKKMRFPIQNGG